MKFDSEDARQEYNELLRVADDRRERYAAAIQEHISGSPEGNAAAADAAMAVADAEHSETAHELAVVKDMYEGASMQNEGLQQNIMAWRLRAGETENENARLRAELAAEKEKYLRFRENRMREGGELENENARLREALREAGKRIGGFVTERMGSENTISRLRAELERKEEARLDALAAVGIQRDTIESVRAVSDRHPDAPFLHGPSIREALKGDSDD